MALPKAPPGLFSPQLPGHHPVRVVGSALGRDTGTVGTLDGAIHIGADGVRVTADDRSWFIAHPRLDGIDVDARSVHLITGERVLTLRTDEGAELRTRIERRVAAFHRADALYRLESTRGAERLTTSRLFSRFENPAAPPDVREEMARWISRRALTDADIAYIKRVLADVANPPLAETLTELLPLP